MHASPKGNLPFMGSFILPVATLTLLSSTSSLPIHSDPLKSDFCLCSSNQRPPLWPPVTLLFDKLLKALFYEYFCLLLLETFFFLDFQLHLRYFHSFYIPWSGLFSCHTILVSCFKFNLTYYISNPDISARQESQPETKFTKVETSKCSLTTFESKLQRYLKLILPIV